MQARLDLGRCHHAARPMLKAHRCSATEWRNFVTLLIVEM
jgi:hypothetical protein